MRRVDAPFTLDPSSDRLSNCVWLKVPLTDPGTVAELPGELPLLLAYWGHTGPVAAWCDRVVTVCRDGTWTPEVLELEPRADGLHARVSGEGRIVDLPPLEHPRPTSADPDLARIATALSHDLRQPLQVIKMFGELGRRGADSKVIGDQVIAASEKMALMLRGLMEWVGITHEDGASCSFDAVCTQVVADLQAELQASGGRCDFVPSEASVPLAASNLATLLQELVRNAIRFRDPDRALMVCIDLRNEPDAVSFAVEDNGPGIPPEQVSHLFGLFAKGDTTAHGEGAGMGLPVVERIVDLAGGTIAVHAGSPGTRFEIRLPIR